MNHYASDEELDRGWLSGLADPGLTAMPYGEAEVSASGMTLWVGDAGRGFYARITGQDSSNRARYGWVEVEGNLGAVVTKQPNLNGWYDGTGNGYALEVNGNEAVPIGTVVWIWQSGDQDRVWWFSHPSPSVPAPQDACVVFYSGYLHLASLSVTEGDEVSAGAQIAELSTHGTGAHLHLSIGDGVGMLSGTPGDNNLVGQTFDCSDVFALPEIGLRLPGLAGPTSTTFDSATIAAIKSRLALPLDAGKGWALAQGSALHYGHEYYAHDITVPPPDDQGEAGEAVYNVAGHGDVTTTVWRVINMGGTDGYAVILRHQFGSQCTTPPSPPGTGSLGVSPHDLDTAHYIHGGHIYPTVTFASGWDITIPASQVLVIQGAGHACFELPVGFDASASWHHGTYEFTSEDNTQIAAVDRRVLLVETDGVVTQMNLAGIAPTNTCDGGQVLLIVNDDSTYDLTIKHATGATAAHQFHLPGGSDWVLAPDESRLFWYDKSISRWRPEGCYCEGGSSPTSTYGSSALGSDYNLTSTLADTGLSVTLPSAGTYLLHCHIYTSIEGNQHEYNLFQLYNNDDATYLNGIAQLELAETTAAQALVGSLAILPAPLTVAASKVIKLRGRTTSTTSAVASATHTVLTYVKIA